MRKDFQSGLQRAKGFMASTSTTNPILEKNVRDKIEILIDSKIRPWIFFNVSGVQIQKLNGSTISYNERAASKGSLRGASEYFEKSMRESFSGSPQETFWSSNFIPPFLEEIITTEISNTVNLCKNRRIYSKKPLKELHGLLESGAQKVYLEMARIDRVLRGNGYPQSVPLKEINDEVDTARKFIREHIEAEIRSLPNFLFFFSEKYPRISGYLEKAVIFFLGIGVGLLPGNSLKDFFQKVVSEISK